MQNPAEEPEDVHDELLRLLFNSADYRIFSPEEKTRYEKDMTTERDRLNQLDYARAEGREKGREEGMALGKAEGLAEGREAQQIETARRMLEDKMPMDVVVKYSGLTEEQVKQLGV